MSLRNDLLVESDKWEENGRPDIASFLRMGAGINGEFKKPISDELLLEQITIGVNNNILVYDNDAPMLHFSQRLVILMVNCFKRNRGCKMKELYIPSETSFDTCLWNFNPSFIYSSEGDLCKAFGVNIIPTDLLNEDDGTALNHYKGLGARLPKEDLLLCVGYNREEEQVMLGSF